MTRSKQVVSPIAYERNKVEMFKREFRVFCAKGPVDLPTVRQRYYKAYRVVRPWLTSDERSDLVCAQMHAEIGEGRKEWDNLCNKIGRRIFGDDSWKTVKMRQK